MNTENLVPNGSGRVGSQGFRLVIVSIRKEGEVTRSGEDGVPASALESGGKENGWDKTG